jgi:(2Fe-2S) ferredoxin
MSYYRYHVFFCVNQRDDGRPCCANHNAQSMRDYAKEKVKALGLAGKGKVRISNAGCMDRCEEGPIMVVYPEATWYTYVDKEDIDEIVEEHLCNGRPVPRLFLPAK